MSHTLNALLVHHPLGMLWPLALVALVVTAVAATTRSRRAEPRWLIYLQVALWSAGLLGCVMVVVGETACAGLMHERTMCRSEMKELGLGLLMYADDWSDRMPVAGRWLESVQPYGEARLGDHPCPAYAGRYPYAMNARLAGLVLAAVEAPADTVLIVEHPCTRPSETTDRLMDDAHRHNGIANLVYVDGHMGQHSPWSPSPLHWSPIAAVNEQLRR